MKITKKRFEDLLNSQPISKVNKESNGGFLPDNCKKQGSYLRRNFPATFESWYYEHKQFWTVNENLY